MIIYICGSRQVGMNKKMNKSGKSHYDVTLTDEGWNGVQFRYPGTNTVNLLK